MKIKKQAPLYIVRNDYSREENGRHPSVVEMVEECDVPLTVDGCRTFRAVMSKEIHTSGGQDIYHTKADAAASIASPAR